MTIKDLKMEVDLASKTHCMALKSQFNC